MIVLALILVIFVNKNVSRQRKEANHDTWKSPVFFLMIFVLRRSQLLKERRRERLSQNRYLLSPALCIPGLVLWVTRVTTHPETHAGWWLPTPGVLTCRRSQQWRITASGGDGAGEGSLCCHFPCRTLTAVKKRLQTPELSIWHFSMALKNNLKTY